jgi:MoaA/NifB/PqqE/SkfB family radical SAM enzyme
MGMKALLESLPILVLSPHSRCNCRCVMCDIWKSDDSRELSAEELERHLDDLDRLQVKWVVLTGGEPLMHSDLFRLCRMLRRREIHISLLSTGLLLERYQHEIVEHVDDVIVSLDGPPEIHDQIRRVRGAYAALSAGVRALHLLRPAFPVSVRSTVQKQNCHSLQETVAAALALGMKSVSFLAADLTSEAFNRGGGWDLPRQDLVALTAEQIPLLDEQVELLVASGRCGGFVLETPAKLRRIVDHFRAHLGQAEFLAPRCNAPWTSAVIEVDGTVRPCFFHRPIGRLGQGKSLLEILNGFEALAFRTGLDVETNPICRRCVCSLYHQT